MDILAVYYLKTGKTPKYKDVNELESNYERVKPPSGKMWLIMGGGIFHTNGALDTIIDIHTQQTAGDIMVRRLALIPAGHGTGGYPFPGQTSTNPTADVNNQYPPLATPGDQFPKIMKSTHALVITSNDTAQRFHLAVWEMDDVF